MCFIKRGRFINQNRWSCPLSDTDLTTETLNFILYNSKHNSLHFDLQNQESTYVHICRYFEISVMDQYLPVKSGNQYNNKTKTDSSFTSLKLVELPF